MDHENRPYDPQNFPTEGRGEEIEVSTSTTDCYSTPVVETHVVCRLCKFR